MRKPGGLPPERTMGRPCTQCGAWFSTVLFLGRKGDELLGFDKQSKRPCTFCRSIAMEELAVRMGKLGRIEANARIARIGAKREISRAKAEARLRAWTKTPITPTEIDQMTGLSGTMPGLPGTFGARGRSEDSETEDGVTVSPSANSSDAHVAQAERDAIERLDAKAEPPGQPGGLRELEVASPYEPFRQQVEFHVCPARFRFICAGTRGGKTTAGAFELARLSFATPRGWFWAISPTDKMLDVAERAFREVLDGAAEGAGGLRLYTYEKKKRRFTLPCGACVEFRSLDNPDSARGPGLDGVWADEATYLKPEAHRVMRTRVSDKRGRIWYTFTPKGKEDVYLLYERGRRGDAGFASFHWESRDNPKFPDEEWEDARRDLPQDFFDQEYRALFLDNVAGVFRGVSACVVDDVGEYCGPISIGLDLAKHRDFTVITALSAEGKLIDFERMNEISWVTQKDEVVRLAEKWAAVIWMDATGPGDPIYDELVERLGTDRVKGIKFTQDSKRQLIQALQSAIEQKQITLSRIEVLLDELKWYEYKRLSTGTIRYEAPKGFTDDCVTSLALANWGRLRTVSSTVPMIRDVAPDGGRPDLGARLGGGKANEAAEGDRRAMRGLGLFARSSVGRKLLFGRR